LNTDFRTDEDTRKALVSHAVGLRCVDAIGAGPDHAGAATRMITVTVPFLPPLEEYQQRVREIWDRCWLTNHGPLVNELESQLTERLGVPHLRYVTNGTTALQLALRALDVRGEVITTPFSYVATTSSIVWEHCYPVMVDIRPDTLNIDPEEIERAITDKTGAILAVHVYGNACDIEALEAISRRHGLPLILDAAHAFGSSYKGRSLYAYGDISTASFHATKLFHTIEGGAVISADAEIDRRVSLLRNFGHVTPTTFESVGINGKNSEFHAAMGLCNLPYVPEILHRRKVLSGCYDLHLKDAPIRRQVINPHCQYNHAYYPVIFESEAVLLHVEETLNGHGIFPRRYFYPPLSSLPYLRERQPTPICDDIAPRVLCLPLYHTLSTEDVMMISSLVSRAARTGKR
jgi:dTDP-4-amino-4,6-dideoxygalactose transaminase